MRGGRIWVIAGARQTIAVWWVCSLVASCMRGGWIWVIAGARQKIAVWWVCSLAVSCRSASKPGNNKITTFWSSFNNMTTSLFISSFVSSLQKDETVKLRKPLVNSYLRTLLMCTFRWEIEETRKWRNNTKISIHTCNHLLVSVSSDVAKTRINSHLTTSLFRVKEGRTQVNCSCNSRNKESLETRKQLFYRRLFSISTVY